MTTVQQIRTVEDLRTVMAGASNTPVTDEDLIWFVCMHNAEGDFSVKDIARMFRAGINPINHLDQVQEFIDSCFDASKSEGYTEYDEEQNMYLHSAVYRFLGVESQ